MTKIGNWRTRQQRYSLKAEVCDGCGTTIFPPRDICIKKSEASIENQLTVAQKAYNAMVEKRIREGSLPPDMDYSYGRRS